MSLMLRPNEYLKLEAHFSYKVFVLPTILLSIGIIIFLAVWSGVAADSDIYFLGKAYSLATILIIAGKAMIIPYIYVRTDNKLKIYAVTNQRVYVRRGIINISEKDIPLAKINDVHISRTIVQRMFNAGDISVQVGNDDSSMDIKDIDRPREFRDTVISAIYEAAVEKETENRKQQQALKQHHSQQRYYDQPNYNQRPNYQQNQPNYSHNQGGYGQDYNQGYNQGGYGQDYNQGYNQGGYNQGYNQGGYQEYDTDDNQSVGDEEEDYYKNY